jgi:D-alanyl-D-alanine carboxypeptidase
MAKDASSTSPPNLRTRSARAVAVGMSLAMVCFSMLSVSPALAADAQASGRTPLRVSAEQVMASGAVGFTATVNDGHRRETVVVGLADRATGRQLHAGDQVEIGSNTKTFMATVALQLVAEHRLRLSDPVDKWLPGVVPNGRSITVRMLLNHTSGIYDYTGDPTWWTQVFAEPDRVWRPDELVAVAVGHPPTFAPGAGWAYSNTNYILVGMILQKVTRTAPAELIARRITGPLHLTHTFLPVDGQSTNGRHRAHGYMVWFAADGTRQYTETGTGSMSYAGYAGSMISTTGELQRFFTALLGGHLLPPAQLAQMRTAVAVAPPGQPDPTHTGYGLGLFTTQTPCGTVWGHRGDTLGTGTQGWFSADGTRSTVSAENTELDIRHDLSAPGVQNFVRAITVANGQMVCQMFDQPVPTAATGIVASPQSASAPLAVMP